MVDIKTLVIGAAALAFLIPQRVGEAGQAAGTFAGGIAEGITALGTIQISPEFAPNISPRVVPEFGLRTDFPDWLDVTKYFPSFIGRGSGTAGTTAEEEEVVTTGTEAEEEVVVTTGTEAEVEYEG